MASTIHDAAGKPDAALLDGEECTWITAALQQYLMAEQSRQRKPSLTFPVVILRALAALEPVAARWRVSADGHTDEAATREMSGGGRGSAVVTPAADMLNTVQIAEILNITQRQARRIAAATGVNVGGRWFVRRADIEQKAS